MEQDPPVGGMSEDEVYELMDNVEVNQDEPDVEMRDANDPPESSNHDEQEDNERDNLEGDSDAEDVGIHEEPLIGAKGYNYMGRNMFYSGRFAVDILIIVPLVDGPDTLNEALEILNEVYNNPGQSFNLDICIDYNNFKKEALANAALVRNCTVYEQKFVIPQDYELDLKYKWMAQLMVVPLILHTLRFQWKRINIHTLLKSELNTMITRLLDNMWSSEGDYIKEVINGIIENPDCYMCENCTENCHFVDEYWHMKLNMFLKSDPNPPNDIERPPFLERFNLFASGLETPVVVLERLKDMYLANERSQDRVFQVLQDNSDNYLRGHSFTTYLVVLFDGRNMEAYHREGLTVNDLVRKDDIQKSLYAGFTVNGPFRRDHFTQQTSGLNKLMSGTSKLAYVRKEVFNTYLEARRDEGLIIDILKQKVLQYKIKSKILPFKLININSSQSFILGLSETDQRKSYDYISSDVPVIAKHPCNVFVNDLFRGNYNVIEEIPPTQGRYQLRNFGDVALQKQYLKMDKRAPR